MALMLTKEVSVLEKYIDFLDVFFEESVAVLSKRLNINKQAIDLELGK